MTVPSYVDIGRLCQELCISERTADTWVRQGILPPPRQRGGKRLWRWSQVVEYMEREDGSEPDKEADDVRRATRAALAESR